MKHYSDDELAKAHYIPANNAVAFFLCYGDGAKLALEGETERVYQAAIEEGRCPVCAITFRDWYKASTAVVLRDLEAGQKPHTEYPSIENLCAARNS